MSGTGFSVLLGASAIDHLTTEVDTLPDLDLAISESSETDALGSWPEDPSQITETSAKIRDVVTLAEPIERTFADILEHRRRTFRIVRRPEMELDADEWLKLTMARLEASEQHSIYESPMGMRLLLHIRSPEELSCYTELLQITGPDIDRVVAATSAPHLEGLSVLQRHSVLMAIGVWAFTIRERAKRGESLPFALSHSAERAFTAFSEWRQNGEPKYASFWEGAAFAKRLWRDIKLEKKRGRRPKSATSRHFCEDDIKAVESTKLRADGGVATDADAADGQADASAGALTFEGAAPHRPGYWTQERCVSEAIKHRSQKAWRRGGAGSYHAARRNGWVEICMDAQRATRAAAAAAIAITVPASTITIAAAPVAEASDDGDAEGSASMQKDVRPSGYWTAERCVEEAIKYTTAGAWRRGSRGSYNAATRRGWYEQCVTAMRAAIASKNAAE